MAITLSQNPPIANARLEATDVQDVINALTPVLILPEQETWSNVLALNLNVQPDGSAVVNVRFKQ
jgi:hypothetical protein